MADGFRAEVRELLHDKLLDAAREITTTEGWSRLTMGAVASRAGISRQHLYNEIGTKQRLGHALVDRETDVFLVGMCEQLRAHPGDVPAGVEAAVRHALDRGADNVLLKAVLAADGSQGASLLPLLTARPEAVLTRATRALRAELAALLPPPLPPGLDVHVDALVRLVLSHLTQPSGPAEQAVTQARWLTTAALGRG